ncbi:MAG: hypothetical protein ABSE50_06855 [Xanthobacteraceae bacterium]|jgi:hypothetical protein
MFVGHYGVAFGAKPVALAVPLWIYFIAVQWLDVVWSVLVLLGVEKLHIVPGFTEANPYDLYYMPYTHGLPGAVILSLALGAVVAASVAQQRGRAFLIVSAASFSHWILDLIVHTPDLPLYGNSDKVGFGLWRHVAISFPLEIAVLLAGTWYFARRLPPADQRGHWVLRIFTVGLVALQAYANFGPPPSSEVAMAVMALSLYVVLAALAAGLEYIRKAH